jgi:DNA-binding beta-propeller fold protein YncE
VVNTETARVDRTLAIAAPIRDFVLGPGDIGYALTSDLQRGGAVHVIDLGANAVVNVVEIGGAPTQMVLSLDGTLAYVVDVDHVAVLCTLTSEVVDRIDVGAQPSGVALGAGLYIADYSGRVTMVSVASSMPMYPEFAASELITVPELPVLEAAAV